MRFMHVADIHLGYQQYGSKERFDDFSRVFLHIVEWAICVCSTRAGAPARGLGHRRRLLDEPTANLDDHRRDNLAEQILNVKGCSQLFVISHDDTFERDTDHVVRVVKEDGVSRVLEA